MLYLCYFNLSMLHYLSQ